MDEFAQSRGDDDLFDDEITPLPTTEQTDMLAQQTQRLSLQASQPPTQPLQNQEGQQAQRSRGRGQFQAQGRGRGRGRGKGNIASAPATTSTRGGLADSKWGPKASISEPKEQTPVPEKEQEKTSQDDTAATTEQPAKEAPTQTEQIDPLTTTEDPSSQPKSSKPPAVRGDRTQTGGLKKPRLTEDELTARLSAAKAKAQSLAAAHARAQADAADFEERERVAQSKRREEEKVSRVLAGEREKNRARKMQAVGGREWDAEKNEEDFRQARYGERTRRGSGMQDETDLSIYEWQEAGERGHGTGRGRGRGRGRGEFRGRAGRGRRNQDGVHEGRAPDTNVAEDFPALPASMKANKQDQRPEQQRQNSQAAAGGSWADQMAAE